MPDTLLSQSLIQNNADSQLIRDPFQQAKSQYDSRNSQDQSSTIISSSPLSNNADPSLIQQQQPLQDFRPMMEKLGIDAPNLKANEIGKFQLMNKLKQKFGQGFNENKDAKALMQLFDQHLQQSGGASKNGMNEMLANAERTLGALFK